MDNKEQIFNNIQKTGNLPTLPDILLKLLSTCDNEDMSLNELGALIAQDAPISAKVLELVNSAYYGLQKSIESIEQAVVYIGANAIKNLVITMSIHQVFEEKQNSSPLPIDTGWFWHHSLMSATLARSVAEKTGIGSADDAYLAGLFHDLGKLILASAYPDKYRQITDQLTSSSETIKLENKTLGLDHCETGSRLVRQWNLNPLIADAILYHHRPLEQIKEALPLVKLVYFANLLQEDEFDIVQKQNCGSFLLGLDRNDIETIWESSEEGVRELTQQMGIRLGSKKSRRPDTTTGTAVSHADLPHQPHEPDSSEPDEGTGSDSSLEDYRPSSREQLARQVKNFSLLTTILDDLVQTDDFDSAIAACEQALNTLFSIDRVLFFLPETGGLQLLARTSGINALQESCRGLTLPAQKSSSRIVRAYQDPSSREYIRRDDHQENIADQQILHLFDCTAALPVPLTARGEVLGVMVLAVPEGTSAFAGNDFKLVSAISRQTALRLYMERQKVIQAEKLHEERMAAISMTARKFAHEINNPLGIISNYLAGMKLKMNGRDEITGELDIIGEEIQRIATMISQMDMFSQAPFSQFDLTDLNEIIQPVIQLSRTSLFDTENKNLSFIPGTGLPLITTSRDAIKQILINLIKNGAEAMESGGRVMVRTRRVQTDSQDNRDGIEIIVADTGPGLPEKVRENLFKPFVTTKQNGHSGLGLSIVHKAVKDIGGNLSCSESDKEGTTFTIFLPTAPN